MLNPPSLLVLSVQVRSTVFATPGEVVAVTWLGAGKSVALVTLLDGRLRIVC